MWVVLLVQGLCGGGNFFWMNTARCAWKGRGMMVFYLWQERRINKWKWRGEKTMDTLSFTIPSIIGSGVPASDPRLQDPVTHTEDFKCKLQSNCNNDWIPVNNGPNNNLSGLLYIWIPANLWGPFKSSIVGIRFSSIDLRISVTLQNNKWFLV